jgi:hypothetical protein
VVGRRRRRRRGSDMRRLFARARNNASLAPGERALLKLIEGLACAALVAALPIVADALGHGSVNWGDVGRAALAAGVTAAMLALIKYFKAYGDPPLAPTPPQS